ncbi:protein-L-isoaspartate O-methyltransferase [Altererythrobacter sp. ZODW24]|uniref:protein-L-isoaspartate O-methyltransferase family protein n=1 Tax=Altererythrobacter sp. ZODW24 TaxID=2185142 RepID=UPI000DF7C44F|nr:protein-L-isoaspartate O-methyltransferase [Altererythrobacter sp. ZODW24]
MTLTKTRPSTDFTAARRAMIDSQLRVTGVNDPAVLARFLAVPREDHVPAGARSTCYMDRAAPLGGGRYLAAPLSHGLMLEEAAPVLGDKALLVDGGSGYLAELVRPMVGSLDIITPEEAAAKSRKKGDFTLLLVDGAVEELSEELIRRIADNGRVVTGMIRNGVTHLAVGRKAAGKVTLVPLAEVGFPRMAQFDKPAGWSF